MDPVSRNLDSDDMETNSPEEAVADVKARLGDLQIGGGGDMLIDEYDAVDEKPDVAIITPDDSAEESEPLADDCASSFLLRKVECAADQYEPQMRP